MCASLDEGTRTKAAICPARAPRRTISVDERLKGACSSSMTTKSKPTRPRTSVAWGVGVLRKEPSKRSPASSLVSKEYLVFNGPPGKCKSLFAAKGWLTAYAWKSASVFARTSSIVTSGASSTRAKAPDRSVEMEDAEIRDDDVDTGAARQGQAALLQDLGRLHVCWCAPSAPRPS